jgi:hypothetical protein
VHLTLNLEEPAEVLRWASQVDPEGQSQSRSKLESERFIASYIAACVRIAHGVQKVIDAEHMDAIDDA